jgi:TIR domain
MAGKVFINYRRDDDPGFTRALYQRLEQEFPGEDIFMDVEGHIKPGDNFREVLTGWVAACDVFLAVIGPRWADLMGKRSGDPNDFVTIEIGAALNQGKRVIPVLVGGATMPQIGVLPEVIRELASRQKVDLRPERFPADCQGLVAALKSFLEQGQREHAARAEEQQKAEEKRRKAEEERRRQEVEAAERARAERQKRDDRWAVAAGAAIAGLVLSLPIILWATLGRPWGTASLTTACIATIFITKALFSDYEYRPATGALGVLGGQVITFLGLVYDNIGVAIIGAAAGFLLAVVLWVTVPD